VGQAFWAVRFGGGPCSVMGWLLACCVQRVVVGLMGDVVIALLIWGWGVLVVVWQVRCRCVCTGGSASYRDW